MSYLETEIVEALPVFISNHIKELGIDNIQKEIIDGLNSEYKHISSKYFYDEKGSKLFEDITRLPEYYPTRTEKKILEEIAPELMHNIQNIDLVELGSGDSSKINILLNSVPKENIETITYTPVDVSHSAIQGSAEKLIHSFPGITINGLVADFINQLDLIPSERQRMFFFLGSTIGNFNEETTHKFLKDLSSSMNIGDTFLLGLDLVKPIKVLHDAYNDSQNVTAEFNKNILNVINDIINTDFDPNDFKHKAFFNQEKSRIEMHLVANKNIEVNSPYSSLPFKFRKGESIHTENSYKFSFEQIKNFEKIT
jgi:L-histidine N-alpha-methyltransferase